MGIGDARATHECRVGTHSTLSSLELANDRCTPTSKICCPSSTPSTFCSTARPDRRCVSHKEVVQRVRGGGVSNRDGLGLPRACPAMPTEPLATHKPRRLGILLAGACVRFLVCDLAASRSAAEQRSCSHQLQRSSWDNLRPSANCADLLAVDSLTHGAMAVFAVVLHLPTGFWPIRAVP